jgi:hypothetical protein
MDSHISYYDSTFFLDSKQFLVRIENMTSWGIFMFLKFTLPFTKPPTCGSIGILFYGTLINTTCRWGDKKLWPEYILCLSPQLHSWACFIVPLDFTYLTHNQKYSYEYFLDSNRKTLNQVRGTHVRLHTCKADPISSLLWSSLSTSPWIPN